MPRMMCEASRKSLEEKVDAGNKALMEAFAALTKDLETYGFHGSLKLQLTVSINVDGERDAVVLDHTTNLTF